MLKKSGILALAVIGAVGLSFVASPVMAKDKVKAPKGEDKVTSTAADDEGKKEEKIESTDVPAAVMAAFKAKFATVAITEVERETYADGSVHYDFKYTDAAGTVSEAEFNAAGEYLENHNDADGEMDKGKKKEGGAEAKGKNGGKKHEKGKKK